MVLYFYKSSILCFFRHAEIAIQRTCLLCHKFMHTIQMYFRFITVEILEPEWDILEAEISRAEDVDRVIEVHRLFVSRVRQFVEVHHVLCI